MKSFLRWVTVTPAVITALCCFVCISPGLASDERSASATNADFKGIVLSLPTGGLIGNWVVGGKTVKVTSSTRIQQENGLVAAGACVEVKGQTQADATVNATEVDTRRGSECGQIGNNPVQLRGTVQQLPASGTVGDWLVGGRVVHVFPITDIGQGQGPVAVGSCVDVKGETAADNSINAEEIDVRSSSAGCTTTPPAQQQNFTGIVQKLPASGLVGDWQVSGHAVHVLSTTKLDQTSGVFALGACVQVIGTMLADSSTNATQINSKAASACATAIGGVAVELKGRIEALSSGGLVGNWQVSGKIVHVLPGTVILPDPAGAIAVGKCVDVKGQTLTDGTIDAFTVDARPDSDCAGSTGQTTVEVMGLVETLPLSGGLVGDWQISGKVVHVLSTTQVDQQHGAVTIGSCVDAKGTLQTDQSVNATTVTVQSVSGTCIASMGVVSAASLSTGMVTPGEIISIFGVRLGPSALVQLRLANGKVMTNLAGVRVLFDGVAAPVLAAMDGQINVVVPFSVSGKTKVQIQVENNGAWSNPITVAVGRARPALFTANNSGSGQAAALNQDNSVNSKSRRANRGSIVMLFATGSGMQNRNVDDGEVISGTSTKPALPVTVRIGGVNAEVQFAGAAPSLVAGVLQINVRIPSNVAAGDVPVQINIGDFSSPTGVTLAVQ